MFKSVWLSVAIIPFLATPIFAQTATSEPDEIVSEGTIRGGDPAMGAFFSGDFETAEIEFKKNFRKLKRADMVLNNSAAATRGMLCSAMFVPGHRRWALRAGLYPDPEKHR